MKQQIKVAAIGVTEGTVDVLNDYDVTNSRIKYFSLKHIMEEKHLYKRIFKFFFEIRKYNVLIIVFVFPHAYLYALIAKLFGIPCIAHWIGTDVFSFINNICHYKYLNIFNVHLSNCKELQLELEEKKIKSDILRIEPGHISYDVAKMPSKHAILIYMPEGREIFYGYETIIKVIEKFSEIDFYIVANSNHDLFPQSNVKLLGFISREDMNKVFDSISIIIRCAKHDGWGRIVTEGLFKGKKIIYNFCEHPYTIKVETYDDICKALNTILSTSPQICYEAHEYAMLNHLPSCYSKKMEEVIRGLLNV